MNRGIILASFFDEVEIRKKQQQRRLFIAPSLFAVSMH